jgi:tRNA threonylcarbamoyladenosine biosynthesis protein TsaB
MKILAVDTALSACSAAVFDSGKARMLATALEPMATGHAERLAPMVRDIMAASGEDFASLDRIAATIGPGTFTGLRIGLSFARGLALALSRPVVGISTLQALAAMVADNPDALPIAAAIDARRANLYFQLFSADLKPLSDPRLCSPAEAAGELPRGRCLAMGSGVAMLTAAAGPHVMSLNAMGSGPTTDAAIVAQLASRDENLLPPKPLYLRSHDAKPNASYLRHIAQEG